MGFLWEYRQGDSLTKAFLLFYYTIDSQKPVSNTENICF